jgi:hypothetical protein
MDASDWIAIYAAIVATGALFLEVRRWFETGVHLHLSTMPEMQMVSSSGSNDHYIVVNVANRGDMATTITHLGLASYGSLWRRLRNNPEKQFVIPNPMPPGGAQPLPFLLEPGCHWTGLAKHNPEIRALTKKGDLWALVITTHQNGPIYCRIKNPTPIKGEPLGS